MHDKIRHLFIVRVIKSCFLQVLFSTPIGFGDEVDGRPEQSNFCNCLGPKTRGCQVCSSTRKILPHLVENIRKKEHRHVATETLSEHADRLSNQGHGLPSFRDAVINLHSVFPGRKIRVTTMSEVTRPEFCFRTERSGKI